MTLWRRRPFWQKARMVSERGVSRVLAELRRLARARRPPPRSADAVALIGRLLAMATLASSEAQAGDLVFRFRAGDDASECLLTCRVRTPMEALRLTGSERDVADRLCEGKTLAQIARLRGVTINTVKSQVRQIFRKLDVDSRVALVRRLCP
jgi:DNA-binding CsgD family transcriptional regulator